MKKSLYIPISCSLLLGAFMLVPNYGFMSFINSIVSGMDYYLVWSVSPIDTALIAIIPWIVYRLLETEEKRSVKNQLGLNLLFMLGSLIFFTFGFLLLSIDPGTNPLIPSYVKFQPFGSYWSIWFAASHILVTVFFYINKRQKEAEDGLIDK